MDPWSKKSRWILCHGRIRWWFLKHPFRRTFDWSFGGFGTEKGFSAWKADRTWNMIAWKDDWLFFFVTFVGRFPKFDVCCYPAIQWLFLSVRTLRAWPSGRTQGKDNWVSRAAIRTIIPARTMNCDKPQVRWCGHSRIALEYCWVTPLRLLTQDRGRDLHPVGFLCGRFNVCPDGAVVDPVAVKVSMQSWSWWLKWRMANAAWHQDFNGGYGSHGS